MLGPQDKVGNINNIYFSNHCDNSSNSVSEVYEYISDIYKDLNLSGVTLWTYDNTAKRLKKEYALGISELTPQNICINLDYYLWKDYYIFEDPYYKKLFKDEYVNVYPLISDSKILGLVTIYFTAGNFNSTVNKYITNIIKRIKLSFDNSYLAHSLKKELESKEEIENEFKYLLDISTDLYIITNADGIIKKVSNGFSTILGWLFKDVENSKLTSLLSPFYKNTVPSVSEMKEKCSDTHIYCNILAKDGSTRLIEYWTNLYNRKKYGWIINFTKQNKLRSS